MDPVTLATIAGSMQQGGGEGGGGGMFGGGGLFGGGEDSTTIPQSAQSGISGTTTFSTGGLNVTKSDSMTAIIIAGVAVLVVAIAFRKGK